MFLVSNASVVSQQPSRTLTSATAAGASTAGLLILPNDVHACWSACPDCEWYTSALSSGPNITYLCITPSGQVIGKVTSSGGIDAATQACNSVSSRLTACINDYQAGDGCTARAQGGVEKVCSARSQARWGGSEGFAQASKVGSKGAVTLLPHEVRSAYIGICILHSMIAGRSKTNRHKPAHHPMIGSSDTGGQS